MTERFDFKPAPLAGLYSIGRRPLRDSRGFFSRFFCAREFQELGLTRPLAQMNHTMTAEPGTVRGMHFQRPPFAEIKVVTCIRGKVFDVAVDVRRDSPTFLHWHGEVLSADNQVSLYIPEGFAHGFQALTPDAELLYLHTEYFEPGAEAALNAKDPRLAIDWPLEIAEMSERDRGHPLIDPSFNGITTP